MQEVPNPECSAGTSGGVGSNHETARVRWSRIPRVQLLPNKNDQRVPLYFDQTVPVWPLREPIARGGGNHSSSAQSPSSAPHADGGSCRHPGRGGFGVRKAERNGQAVWFRSLKGVLKASSVEAHACNVSEMLRGFACERASSTPGAYPYALSSSTWSGIEQDLFTCTKVFTEPAEFTSNKKSKSQSTSKE